MGGEEYAALFLEYFPGKDLTELIVVDHPPPGVVGWGMPAGEGQSANDDDDDDDDDDDGDTNPKAVERRAAWEAAKGRLTPEQLRTELQASTPSDSSRLLSDSSRLLSDSSRLLPTLSDSSRLLPTPSDSFRLLPTPPTPSDSSRLLPTPPDSFRLLPTASDSLRLLPTPSVHGAAGDQGLRYRHVTRHARGTRGRASLRARRLRGTVPRRCAPARGQGDLAVISFDLP